MFVDKLTIDEEGWYSITPETIASHLAYFL